MKKLLLASLIFSISLFSFAQVIDSPAVDVIVECDGAGNTSQFGDWLNSNGYATASATCGNVTWTNNFSGVINDLCGNTGYHEITFTATGDCGSESTTATFTIEDTTSPSLDTFATHLTVECDGSGSTSELNAWLNSNAGATASDSCGGVSWVNDFIQLNDGCGSTGSATVTFTATDDCGNVSLTSATFTIEDATAPYLETPSGDTTVSCGEIGLFDDWLANHGNAVAYDDCSAITWSYTLNIENPACGDTVVANFSATDACGNSVLTVGSFIVEASTCPTTPIVLTSQAEVDAFAANYPDCTELQNSLTISGADITDLTPLSGIVSVKGLTISNTGLSTLEGLNLDIVYYSNLSYYTLEITDNEFLTNISSLSSTLFSDYNNQNFGFYVWIANNPVLASLNGLQGLSGFGFLLAIDNNDSLQFLTGLENITGVEDISITSNDTLFTLNGLTSLEFGGFLIDNNFAFSDLTGLNSLVQGGFSISNNPVLQSLNGLENVNSITSLSLINNPSLGNLNAINFTSFIDNPSDVNIQIINNSPLSVCDIQSICEAISFCETNSWDCNITIENNAEGCNSITQVAFNCGLVPTNDECSDSIILIEGEPQEFYNDFGSASSQVPSCNDVDRIDVWFTFNSGSFTTVDIISSGGLSMQMWEGSCGALTQVPNACDSDYLFDIPVTPDTDYYLQVWLTCEGCRVSSFDSGLSTIFIQNGTLSTQEFQKDSVTLYPNPVNNQLTISSTSILNQIEVYNLLGQSIMKATPQAFESSLDFSQLKTGIYLVKVASASFEQTFKVVKE